MKHLERAIALSMDKVDYVSATAYQISEAIKKELRYIERKEGARRVFTLLGEGKKIDAAIEASRTLYSESSIGLKEAKDMIDNLENIVFRTY